MEKSTRISDVMTKGCTTLSADSTVGEAAKAMRDDDIGGVVVTDGSGKICGFLTDRDIVLRAIADGKNPTQCKVGSICTQQVAQIEPDASIADAIRIMAEQSVRRIPVVDNGQPVGVVSLGDLAQARDPESLLGKISSAPPQH